MKHSLPAICLLALLVSCASPASLPRMDAKPPTPPVEEETVIIDQRFDEPVELPKPTPERLADITVTGDGTTEYSYRVPASIRRPSFPAKLVAYQDIHSLLPRSLRGPPSRWPLEDVRIQGGHVTFRAIRPGSVNIVVSWEGIDRDNNRENAGNFRVTVTTP